MTVCKNCFTHIEDMRSGVRCSMCNAPLHKDCAINEGKIYCDVCYTVKEETVNEPTIDFKIPDVIRRSYIETYKSCPLKFYYEVIKGMEAPPTIYTQLGIDLHELFDKASNDKSYTKDKMVKDFESIWANYKEDLFEDEKQKEKMYNRGIDSIDTFYVIIQDMPEPFQTEETIQFDVGEDLPKVQATSDRINLVDGELEMVDWKTGNVMVGQRLSSDLQAPLYIYSVMKKYDKPVRKFTFYYLEENKTRVFERVNNEEYECKVNKRIYRINIMDAIREVQSVFAQIKKGNFNIPRDTSKMYFTCKMCHLKEKEICKGADIEVWKQYNK